MTLDTFFKTFDQFADAPDAVAKMRDLVLWSAFSGAFSAEKRDQPMPDEWASGDAPTLPSIPSSWTWQRGRDVFNIIRGVTYSKSDASNTEAEGTFPILRANNIGKGVNFENLVYVPKSNVKDEQFLRAGDILIAMSSGSKKLVGKAAPILSDFPGAFGAFCGVIRNKSKMPDTVLARYFETPQYTSWVTAAGKGIGINNIGKGDLESLPVPTPPLAEQKRIVAKVDELMALCDRLEAQQQQRDEQASALARASLARFAEAPTPANLNLLFHKSYSISPADLRKAILAMAVRGKLLPQNPKDEPASKLLKRIDLLKREAATARRTRSTENGDSPLRTTAPFEIPSTWIWTELSNLGHTSTGKTPPTGNSEFFSGNIPFVGPGQIRPSGEMIEAEKFISELGLSSSTEAKPGDILMVCIGGSIGKAAIVRERLAFNQQLNLISPIEIETGYLFSVLNAEYFYDRVISSSSGSATPIINRSKWDSILVPLPPLAEQRRIVAKVDQLMALVDQLETQLAASRTTAKNLLEALVAELS